MMMAAAISACSRSAPAWRAVFAVAGDVKNWPQFVLQLQGLLHQLFRAGVVVYGRQDGEGRFTGEEDFAGVFHGLLCGKGQWGILPWRVIAKVQF
jgi:hypothetical protein